MKPKIKNIFKLKCLYCGETPLLQKGAWFEYAHGCPTCKYLYEREEGYWAGATWMVLFTLNALFGIAVAAVVFLYFPEMDVLVKCGLISASLLLFGLFFYPFGNAIWMYADHMVHPLSGEDVSRFENPRPPSSS